MNCYAFPPFGLLARVLAKIRHDEAVVLLIAPVWPTQSWYPLLLQLSTGQPILLPRLDNLLSLPDNPGQHPLRHKLNLVAWTLSGKLFQTRDFQSKRLTPSVHLGQQALRNSTRECGTNDLAGVKRQIDLLQTSVIQVVEFLTDCYYEDKGYSTINTYRSALSTTLCAMDDDRDSLG